MTYCIGYWLEKGLVLASDSRTNAGVDYISTYSKMYSFQPAPDRLFVILAAGSLSIAHQIKVEADDPSLDTMIDVWIEAQREALYRLPRLPWEKENGD